MSRLIFTNTGFSLCNFYTKVNPPCYGCTYKKMVNDLPFYIDPTEVEKFDGIVIHHSATKDGKTYSWPSIKKYHTSFRIDGYIVTKEEYWKRKREGKGKKFVEPWSDFAYHYGIEFVKDKLIYMIGRPLSKWGGHTRGMPRLIGICNVGNYDLKEPSKIRYYMTASLCVAIIKANPSIQIYNTVRGHSFYNKNKTCPGKKFSMKKLSKLISKGV